MAEQIQFTPAVETTKWERNGIVVTWTTTEAVGMCEYHRRSGYKRYPAQAYDIGILTPPPEVFTNFLDDGFESAMDAARCWAVIQGPDAPISLCRKHARDIARKFYLLLNQPER